MTVGFLCLMGEVAYLEGESYFATFTTFKGTDWSSLFGLREVSLSIDYAAGA